MALDLTYDPNFGADSGGELDFTYDAGATSPKKQNKGILGDLKDTLVEGSKSAGRSIAGAANVYTGNESGLVEKAKAQETAVKPVPLQGFYDEVKSRVEPLGEDPGLIDSIKAVGGAVANKPYGAGLAVVEQLPNAAPAIGGALLGAKGGAALGAFAGPVGAAVGGIAGGIAGMFIGNSAIETGYKGIEAAQDGSVTPEEFSRAKSEGAVKGGVITAVDAATLGLSKAVTSIPGRAVESATRKALTKAGVDVADEAAVLAARQSPEISAAVRAAQDSAFASANTIGKRAAAGGAALGLETVGEGLGEYFGELAATGRANVADAVLEGLMSLGQSGAEVAWGAARNKEQNKANTWDVAAQQERPAPTMTADPVPVRQRIDAMMGIDHEMMNDKDREQYEKDLAAAFLEPVGFTSDANGLEIPFTMADYLNGQVRAEDESRARPLRQQAGQSADARLQQIADEESTQQPDISPSARGIAAPPVIPVVGPLSAIANAAVQSGAHQTAVMQQAAAEQAKAKPAGPLSSVAKQSEQTNGPIATQAAAQVATPGNQAPGGDAPGSGSLQSPAPTGDQGRIGGGAEVAAQGLRPAVSAGVAGGQTPNAVTQATTAGDPFIQSRSDAQLNWLAERGKPELKAAAVAEIQQRQGNVYQNLPTPNGELQPTAEQSSAVANEQQAGAGLPAPTAGDSRPAPVANTLRDATPKESEVSSRANDELDLNRQPTGWKRINYPNGDGVLLVSHDGKKAVAFPSEDNRSGTSGLRASAKAQAFAIDNPYSFATDAPQGELVTKPLYGNNSAQNQEPIKNASPTAATVSAENVAPNQEPIKNQSPDAGNMVPAVDAATAEQSSDVQAASADPALQNRDRGRAASVNQMQSIARNPDYMRLGPSRTPDSGAPMVFAVGNDTQKISPANFGANDTAVMSDGQRVPFRYAVVDASQVQPSNFADGATNPEFTSTNQGTIKALNNGRTAGVRSAHSSGNAATYAAELLADNAHGVSPEAIRNTPNPMLVRVYAEQSNTGDMAAKSQGQGLGMSASERATQDSELMTSDVLDKFAPGDIASAGNRDFVRAFVGKLAENELADMMDATGNLSQDGRRRIEAALLTAAYGKSDLVQELFESTDTDIKAIGNALKVMSGQWASMRNAAKDGVIDPDTDMTANLIEAVNIVRRSRAEGSSIAELAGQGDLMGGNYLNELSELFLRIFYKGKNYDRARGGDKVIAALQEIVTSAMNTKAEAGLFGDSFKATPKQIVESARSKIDEENKPASQSSLFGANGQATAVSQGNRGEGAAQSGEVGSRPVGTGSSQETGKQAEPVDKAAEQEPKPNAKEAPSKYGIYQLADGSFAKFDRVWYRGEKTERAAMLSEMVIPGNSAPKDRLDSQSWVFAKGFSRNDFDGSPLRLTKNGEDAAVDAKKQEEAKPSEMDALKAEMGQAIGELASILGAKQNLTPEEESRIIPVMSKIFRIAAKMGYIKFKDAANYVLDQIRQLAGADVADKISIDNLQAGYINIAKEIGGDKREAMSYDSIEDLEKSDVTDQRSGTDLEPDSGNANPENGMGEEGVRTGRGGDGGTGGPGVQGSEESLRAGSSSELSGPEAAAAGERGNLEIYTGATELSPGSAGNSVDSGSGDSGLAGAPVEPDAAKATRQSATGPNDLKEKVLAQAKADKNATNKEGIEAIRAALPILTENQQDDVAKAEARFAVPDGYGMLFTNGTGTGKTFTGLGTIKRFANQGKANILIVAPSDKVIEDWQNSGKLLGLDISRLTDTKDSGRGIVITTYENMGQNNALASRNWDLVVHDEAHKLAQNKDGDNTNALKNLRAISLHPDGVFQRHSMLNADDIQRLAELDADAKMQRMSDDQRMWAQAEKTQADADKLRNELKAKQDAIKEDVAGRQGEKRPRALFLSATPFAYEKTVDWANGYIFDYNEGRGDESREFRGYNVGSNSDQFMMQHFGYRMRTGKLTQPDAKVDSGLMQRQFNTWLKKKGSLSGRMLDVAADYDRKFILTESAIGSRIDEALQWFGKQRDATADTERKSAIYDVEKFIADKFDYLSRRYLLEAIKAHEVIQHVREHLALGRKVVVFHDYNKGGGFNPFNLAERAKGQDATTSGNTDLINAIIREFRAEFSDLIRDPVFNASSPIDTFKAEFPGVLLFNGPVGDKVKRASVAKFQDDASGPQVILVQSDAGKEGISLHDTTGKHQRVLFNLGQPTAPTKAIQIEGRIYRTGQVTDAILRYLNTGTDWEKWAFATTVAQRASAAENLGMGELARALKDAFISGFEESDDYRAGMEGEGKGGKERDKAANDALTEYDRARAFYFGTQKKTSKTKAQEGADYFATPEPVGLKMVEWADIRPGEKVLEPSAGHGAIARWIPDTAEKTAIEPSMALRPRLAMVFDGQILDSDFESMNVVNKFDAIVMNPPFGSGGKTAVDHLAKAATHLRDGGRIVALLPTGPAADKKFDKWMYESETRKAKPVTAEFGSFGAVYRGDTASVKGSSWNPDFVGVVTSASQGHIYVKHDGAGVSVRTKAEDVKAIEPTGKRTVSYSPFDTLHLVADIKMPASTFERAGTQVMTRIVVIEKQSDAAKASDTRGAYNRDFTNAEDINDLFDQLENMALPNRAKEQAKEEEAPAQTRKERPAPANVGDAVTVNGNEYAIEIYTTNDGKDKRGIWIDEKEAKEINPRAFKSSKMRGTPAEGKFFVDEYWLSKRKPDAAGNVAAPGRISPADKAIYGMAAEGKSAAEILKFIASASRNPFNRQVAKLLLKTGIAPSVTVGDGKTWNIRDAKSGEAFAAAYDPKTNTVALFRPASAERNALHELIHAASLKALAKNGLASAQMKALFAHVEKTGKLNGMYGIRNVDEFIAEAFSNPKFQAALKQVSAAPVGGKPSSAWDWFIRVVRGILGLKQGQDNALSQALDIGIGVMRENMRLNEAGGETRYNAAPGKIKQTDTAAFKKWFGDSKVVDANGEPLVVYHGAPDVRGIFSEGFKGVSRGGVFFAAADYGVADSYALDHRASDYQNAEPQTIPLFLSIKNPMVVDAKGANWKETERHVQEAKDAGHDGIIIKNSVDYYNNPKGKGKATTIYAWFHPTQAKSAVEGNLNSRVDLSHMGLGRTRPIDGATGNNGNFDGSNPDIRYNVADEGWSVSEQAKETVMRLAGRPMLDPSDPFAAENARLREQDQSLWSKAKKQLRRYLAPGGLLPQSVFAEKIKRDSEFQAVEFDVRHLIGGLEHAVKADFGMAFDKLSKEQMRPITEALAGNVPASLPEATKTAAVAMRQYIDGMSTEYLKIIQQKIDAKMLKAIESGKDADKAHAISEIELFEKIKGNIGRYVHRSYQAFDDPKWFEKVPAHVLNASRLYLKQGYMEAGETDAKAAQLAEVTLHEILKNGTAYDSMESFIAESKLGAKDLSVLMRRKEVPAQIRALLGEYPDARLNFTKSATKMGRLIWNTRFLDRVRDMGMGSFFFEGKDRPPNATTQIAADGSEVYAPLNGLWTFPETAQAFKDALGKEQMSDLYRAIVRANGLVKYGKTVLAPTTAMRNWQSAMFFSLANGHFDLTQMKKSISAFREQVSQKATGQDLKYLRHLKQLGVVYDTPYAGEMARLMEDARMEELLSSDKGDAVRWFRKANQLAQGFYTFGDDFWKIIGFENEKAGLMKAGLSLQEAEIEAAKRIRDTYPTYSMVGRGIQWLSRFPLAGTFVSFPAEIIRTSGNMLRTVAADLKSNNPKLRELGMKRAAGMVFVSAAFYSLAALSMAMAGVGDDEDEAIRDLAPEWQKNSTFLYLGRDEKGNLRYFDMSFLDPYGYWKRPITAMLRNQPWEDSLASGLRGMLEPFLGADISAKAIFEAVSNAKESGGKVYKENDGAIDQAVDIADHLRKALQPGVVGNVERLVKAAGDVRKSSGQPYSMEDELVALAGWRATTIEPKTALYYRSFEFTDSLSEARKTLTDTLRDANDVSPEDIKDARERAKSKQEQAFKEMSRLVGAAEAAGMSKMQIVQTLRLSNISQANIASLMRGATPDVSITPQLAARAVRQASQMRGPEFAADVFDRYRQAMAK